MHNSNVTQMDIAISTERAVDLLNKYVSPCLNQMHFEIGISNQSWCILAIDTPSNKALKTIPNEEAIQLGRCLMALNPNIANIH